MKRKEKTAQILYLIDEMLFQQELWLKCFLENQNVHREPVRLFQ